MRLLVAAIKALSRSGRGFEPREALFTSRCIAASTIASFAAVPAPYPVLCALCVLSAFTPVSGFVCAADRLGYLLPVTYPLRRDVSSSFIVLWTGTATLFSFCISRLLIGF